jgi:hypothetical protein
MGQIIYRVLMIGAALLLLGLWALAEWLVLSKRGQRVGLRVLPYLLIAVPALAACFYLWSWMVR